METWLSKRRNKGIAPCGYGPWRVVPIEDVVEVVVARERDAHHGNNTSRGGYRTLQAGGASFAT
jgi:hypothetical protein